MAGNRDERIAHVEANRELRALAAKLRAENKRFPTELRKALVKGAKPAAAAAKRGARALPSTRKKKARKGARKRLRQQLASSVSVQASTRKGLRIVTKMPATREMLPRGMDSGAKGWRHPVFTRDEWVRQAGASWFREPIAAQHDQVKAHIKNVMSDFAKRVTE